LPQEVSGKKMDKKKAIFIALVITVIVLVVPLTIIISRGTSSNAALIWNSFTNLLTDSMLSVYRMFVALAVSFIVAITVGITAARKPLASRIIIPIVDILQSVPILGFFPAAIAFFITLFSGSPIGVELAAIFLIFTSMVWNMIFAVYESVLSIPPDLMETSRACRSNPLLQFRRVYLPASISKLIYNSILSWASGWYFLTAAEIISVGSNTFTLPGLGSLLSKSVASGQYIEALVAIVVLILIIMLTDFFIWRPLESYSNRFRYDYSTSPPDLARRHIPLRSYLQDSNNNIARLFLRRVAFQPIHLRIINPRPLIHIKSNLLIRTLGKLVSAFEFRIFPTVHHWFDNRRNLRLFLSITLSVLTMSAILVIVLEGGVIYKSLSALSNMYFSLYKDPRSAKIVSQIPLALLLSYLRLASAYLITLAWTIPVAIKIAHNPNFERLMPLFQTFAAIPATAFFPFMAILVAYIPGGLEFPSILLILTGMQWYILFNLIGGVRSISGDIEEAAKALRADKGQYIRRVLFPSIYPSFITGSITGWGGGWNSLIVAEFLIYGNKTYSVLGIGSLLDKAAYTLGNTVLLFLIVGVMIAVIVAINRLVWRRLYRKVIRKYSMSG
jgi:NitT/TauT family transport system permease protein